MRLLKMNFWFSFKFGHEIVCLVIALLLSLTKGGKQEEIKKPREGEEQASVIINIFIEVMITD